MGYKLKHIYAFKRACKDLWKYSEKHRAAGGALVIRDADGSARVLGACGLCFALKEHHTETRERLAQFAEMITYDIYGAYNGSYGYLPGLGVWVPDRVALLKFYCETPSGELLKRLVGSPYNREVRGEDT